MKKRAMGIPETSTTLLRDLAGSSPSSRWSEFVARYRPMMVACLVERFPTIEADDLIQDTFVVLMRILPNYRYSPDEKGAFHNYLTGILHKKALKAPERIQYREEALGDYAQECLEGGRFPDRQEEAWRKAVYEIALGQYLADESVLERTREIFRRVAVNGEEPGLVAAAVGCCATAETRSAPSGRVTRA